MRLNRLYFRWTRFTVLIEVGKLDFQSFKSSAAVFFGFIFAFRINDLIVLSLFILGQPILGRFSIILCSFTFLIIFCTAQREITCYKSFSILLNIHLRICSWIFTILKFYKKIYLFYLHTNCML